MKGTHEMNDLILRIAKAIAERNAILMVMDVDAAQRWIVAHGASAPKNVNWEMVLHIARLETVSLPEECRWESRSWLARNGAVSLSTTPQKRECLVALNLIFPKDLFEEELLTLEGVQ